jgi:hypothetical protein
MKHFVLSLLLVVIGTLTFAQPAPLSSSIEADTREAREARDEFTEALEERSKVEALQTPPVQSYLSVGDAILEQARADYEAGNYFAAEHRSEAAEALYSATLELAEESDHDANDLREVNEKLARVEAELEAHSTTDSTLGELMIEAKNLATNLLQPDAAEDVSEAVLYLITAERGS